MRLSKKEAGLVESHEYLIKDIIRFFEVDAENLIDDWYGELSISLCNAAKSFIEKKVFDELFEEYAYRKIFVDALSLKSCVY